MGAQAKPKKAKTLIPHASPNRPNIAGAISGKMAAKIERRTTVAAIALAKYTSYASVRYAVELCSI